MQELRVQRAARGRLSAGDPREPAPPPAGSVKPWSARTQAALSSLCLLCWRAPAVHLFTHSFTHPKLSYSVP